MWSQKRKRKIWPKSCIRLLALSHTLNIDILDYIKIANLCTIVTHNQKIDKILKAATKEAKQI